MLEQTPTLEKFMWELSVLFQVARGARQDNIVHIMARPGISAANRDRMFKMKNIFAVDSFKLGISTGGIIATIMLAFQFFLYLLDGKRTWNRPFSHSTLMIMRAKNHTTAFGFAVSSPMLCIQFFMSLAIMLGVFLVFLILSAASGPVTTHLSMCFMIASLSLKIGLFVLSIVYFVIGANLILMGFPVLSGSFIYQFSIAISILLLLFSSLFTVFFSILPIIFTFLFSMLLSVSQTIQPRCFSALKSALFPALDTLRAQPILMGPISAEEISVRGKNLLTWARTALAQCIRGIIHDRNRLSFRALSFCCQSSKATAFSSGLITPSLGNITDYTFFCLGRKAEVLGGGK